MPAEDALNQETEFGNGLAARLVFMFGSSIAFAIVYATSRQLSSDLPWGTKAAALAISTLVMGLSTLWGRHLAQRHKAKNQGIRDQRGAVLFAQTQDGEVGDFSLYLRAFETTGRSPQEHLGADGGGLPGFDVRSEDEQFLDFETALAEAMEPNAPLVALGLRGEHVGAGRIEVAEDRWQEALKSLAQRAMVIFLLPSGRPGTRWEIESVQSRGLLWKTIFIMPPSPSRGFFAGLAPNKRKVVQWEDAWEVTLSQIHDLDLQLPEYSPTGRMFLLSSDGQIEFEEGLRGMQDPRTLRQALDRIGKEFDERRSRTQA